MTRMLIHTGVYVNDNEELRIHRRLNILFENVDTYEPVYCILTMEMWIRTFDMFELYLFIYSNIFIQDKKISNIITVFHQCPVQNNAVSMLGIISVKEQKKDHLHWKRLTK